MVSVGAGLALLAAVGVPGGVFSPPGGLAGMIGKTAFLAAGASFALLAGVLLLLLRVYLAHSAEAVRLLAEVPSC